MTQFVSKDVIKTLEYLLPTHSCINTSQHQEKRQDLEKPAVVSDCPNWFVRFGLAAGRECSPSKGERRAGDLLEKRD